MESQTSAVGEDYFDEAYFQKGGEKGTAYDNYLLRAETNPAFLEMAHLIDFVFRPKRCLEVGCAIGVVVRALNDLGVEAHGIDVSNWAVENRVHKGVIRAAVDDLPYPDKHFDLIFSSHAIEHISPEKFDASLAELSRVSDGGMHFHMLPLLGTWPYEGDLEHHKAELRKDPTHHMLHTREWWEEQWKAIGWNTTSLRLVYFNDTDHYELSSCQMTLVQGAVPADVLERAFEWNLRVAHAMHKYQSELVGRGRSPVSSVDLPGPDNTSVLVFTGGDTWKDLKYHPETPLDISHAEIRGVVDVRSEGPVELRIAFVTGTDGDKVGEFWGVYKPGRNMVNVRTSELASLGGTLELNNVREVYFGGSPAPCRVIAQFVAATGQNDHRIF